MAEHTPTDDEREALRRALRGIVEEGIDEQDAVEAVLAEGFRLGALRRITVPTPIQDRIAAGFRRSVVPEPSTEDEPTSIWDCPRCGNDPEDCYCEEPSTEPHCNHCGRPLCATLKPGEFCACECHPPQGEPSDAQTALIDAAEAMTPDEVHQHPMAAVDKLRALARELRAAVTEQGENR